MNDLRDNLRLPVREKSPSPDPAENPQAKLVATMIRHSAPVEPTPNFDFEAHATLVGADAWHSSKSFRPDVPHYTQHPEGFEFERVAGPFPGNVHSAMKYLWRAGLKVPAGQSATEAAVKDLRKAIDFITFEIARLERAAEKAKAK